MAGAGANSSDRNTLLKTKSVELMKRMELVTILDKVKRVEDEKVSMEELRNTMFKQEEEIVRFVTQSLKEHKRSVDTALITLSRSMKRKPSGLDYIKTSRVLVTETSDNQLEDIAVVVEKGRSNAKQYASRRLTSNHSMPYVSN